MIKLTPDARAKIIADVSSQTTHADKRKCCKSHGISLGTYYAWIRKPKVKKRRRRSPAPTHQTIHVDRPKPPDLSKLRVLLGLVIDELARIEEGQ